MLALAICYMGANAQDTLWLKSGKTISGHISSFADNNVTIKVANETTVYKLDEIKSLRYNGPGTKMIAAEPVKVTNEVVVSKSRKKTIEAKPIKIETY